MSDKDCRNAYQSQETRLSNDQLWDKAATSEPITRADVSLASTDTYRGLQNLNEGFNVLEYSDHSKDVYKGSDE